MTLTTNENRQNNAFSMKAAIKCNTSRVDDLLTLTTSRDLVLHQPNKVLIENIKSNSCSVV